jgi:hypothetical protein
MRFLFQETHIPGDIHHFRNDEYPLFNPPFQSGGDEGVSAGAAHFLP